MQIWRVENEAGQGPYANSHKGSGLAFEAHMRSLDKNHKLSGRHPVASPEHIVACSYGFGSRSELDSWFGYFGEFGYDVLRKHGFTINVYDVPECYVETHRKQVIFDKTHAHWLREEDLTLCTRTTKVG